MSSTAVALPHVPAAAVGRRRPPAAVLAAAALALVQAVALLAVGLTSLDALWGDGLRPPGALVAVTLLALAGWVVLAAAGGASLVDGAGSRLLVAVSVGELALAGVLAVGGVVAGGVHRVAVGGTEVPLSALAVTAAAVPLVKLFLGTTEGAARWCAVVRRPARAPRPPAAHRRVRAVTLLVIGAALVAVSLTGQPAPGGTSATDVVDTAH